MRNGGGALAELKHGFPPNRAIGVHIAPDAGAAVVGKRIQSGQHRIAHGLGVEVARLQVNPRLDQFGAMAKRVVDHVLDGRDGLLLRNLHGRSGDDVGFGEHRIFDAAAESVLHQQLLQLQVILQRR